MLSKTKCYSMFIAQETIKSANVELKKDWLLAKSRRADVIERVAEGTKKYEDLWSECKARYESIPFVQKLLEAKEKLQSTDVKIDDLDKQILKLYDDMEARRKVCADVTKQRAIALANFMINERPKLLNIIKEKNEMISNLNEEIAGLLKEQENVHEINITVAECLNPKENVRNEELGKDEDQNMSNSEDDSLLPKLNLNNFDLDIIDVNLDQVKLKRDEILKSIPTPENSIKHNIENKTEHEKDFDYITSPYFKPYKEDKPRNFSERKLINILEDINIHSSEVYDIVKKVNPEKLKPVEEISADVEQVHGNEKSPDDKVDTTILNEDIEEIDLTTSGKTENIIIPPTQFLDITLTNDIPKKKVSFDLQSSVQINEIIDVNKQTDVDVLEVVNETAISQLDASAASDESFMRIKEMLLKKHNLDLSPQFVYGKNTALQKKDNDENIVTSKFFQSRDEVVDMNEGNENEMEVDEPSIIQQPQQMLTSQKNIAEESQKDRMDVDEVVASSSQPKKVTLKPFEDKKIEKSVTGLLFSHGAQGIPESLNVSLSTTGFEDSDFPHCIDSSLLLSPKANVPINADNQEVSSQEVPNFLTGFRKTGLSFFGGPSTSSEPKPGPSQQNEENNFSFNFGGEKKNRGGLFNLFH